MERDTLYILEEIINVKSLQRLLREDYQFQTSIAGLVKITKDLQRETTKLRTKKFAYTNAGIKKHNQQVQKVDTLQNNFIQGVLQAHNHVSDCLKLMAYSQGVDNCFSKSFSELIGTIKPAKHDAQSLKIFNHFRNILAHNNPMSVIEVLHDEIFDSMIVEFNNVENFVFSFQADNKENFKKFARDLDENMEELLND